MIKYVEFSGESSGDILVQAVGSPSSSLEKTASAQLHPEIKGFIDGLRPDNDRLYVLVNAMGAGEYYGSNVNGDYFSESELRKVKSLEGTPVGYNTFKTAGVYRHHKNKDPLKSMGKVKVAAYNEKMHRVELVVEIDREKAASLGHSDLVQSLDDGGHPSVSMGCKVKYDVCRICDNKSKTRADYCEHALEKMGQVLDDGRKVAVDNPDPVFFDISFVVVGADKTSYAMHKLASVKTCLSVDAAAEVGLVDPDTRKVAAQSKLSSFLKAVPAASEKITPSLTKNERRMSKDDLKALCKHAMADVCTTTASVGIVLAPEEYQYLVLTKLGYAKFADELFDSNKVFGAVSDMDTSLSFGASAEYSSDVFKIANTYIDDRSAFEPYISKRVLVKSASSITIPEQTAVENTLLSKIAAGYNGYRVTLLNKVASIVETITDRERDLVKRVAGDMFEDEFLVGSKTKMALSRDAAISSLGVLPLLYLYSAYVEKKGSAGERLNAVDNFVDKHPVFATSMAIGLARLGMGLKESGLAESGLARLFGV